MIGDSYLHYHPVRARLQKHETTPRVHLRPALAPYLVSSHPSLSLDLGITPEDTEGLIKRAGSVMGFRLDAVETVEVERRILSKLSAITSNRSHPLHPTVTSQRSSLSGRLLLCPKFGYSIAETHCYEASSKIRPSCFSSPYKIRRTINSLSVFLFRLLLMGLSKSRL